MECTITRRRIPPAVSTGDTVPSTAICAVAAAAQRPPVLLERCSRPSRGWAPVTIRRTASITSSRTTTAAERAAAGAASATATNAIRRCTFPFVPMITTGARAAVSPTFPITARRPAFSLGRIERPRRESAGHLGTRLAGLTLSMLLAMPALAFEPRINYMLQCQGCHGPDGRGEPGHVPSIRSTLAPLAHLAAGRRYLIQVPGAAQAMLSDQELASLLNWMIATLAR